ncbi:MAG TPA: nuclear transport factor 2 family protein [Chitinophagaceae bacterium]
MKLKPLLSLSIIISLILSCSSKQPPPAEEKKEVYVYKPDSEELYQTLKTLDSIYWQAYNSCDMETQAGFFSDSIEFYHDKGGLSTSKPQILEAIKNNVCGKVTRIEVPGNLEVYPIKDFGAVVMGVHKFFNKEEPNAPSHPGRYIGVWQQMNGQWKMKRIISLH